MALLRALRSAGLAPPAVAATLEEAGFASIADLAYLSAEDAATVGLSVQRDWAVMQMDAVATESRVKALAVVRLESAIIHRDARAAAETSAAPPAPPTSSPSASSSSRVVLPVVKKVDGPAKLRARSRTPLPRRRCMLDGQAAPRRPADGDREVASKVFSAAVACRPECRDDEKRIHAETLKLESSTVLSRLAIVAKFMRSVNAAELGPEDVTSDFIASYVGDIVGMDMPIHTWYAVRWWAGVIGVAWRMPPVPTRRPKDGEIQEEVQAIAADPELVIRLELVARQLEARNDWRLGAVLGAVLMTAACIRFRHLQRSSLALITPTMLCGRCYRGKARVRGVRPAFDWRAPTATLTNVPCAKMLWERWNAKARLFPDGLQSVVMDFSSGQVLSLAAFHGAIRSVAEEFNLTDSPDTITSYSFRRFQPTLADVRLAPHEEKMAIGGWREQCSTAEGRVTMQRSTMPARYADRRAETEASVKCLQLMIARACSVQCRRDGAVPITWDVFRTWYSEIQAADVDGFRKQAAEAIVLKRSEMVVAAGAESFAEKVKARSFSYGAHRIPATVPAVDSVDKPHAEVKEPAADLSEPAERVRWIRSMHPNRKWHFESHQRWLPLCSIRGGRVVTEPRESGVDWRTAFAGGAPCDKCIAQLSPALRRSIDAFLGKF